MSRSKVLQVTLSERDFQRVETLAAKQGIAGATFARTLLVPELERLSEKGDLKNGARVRAKPTAKRAGRKG